MLDRTISNVSSTETDYSYDYRENYSYDYSYDDANSSTAGQKCKNPKNSNGKVFEELQRDIYKDLPHNVYCEIIDTLETQCFEQSILEIWQYNENTIRNLTKQDIINSINNLDKSPYFGFKYNYSELLGSIKRNKTGHIISANAALYNLVTVVDLENVYDRPFLSKIAGIFLPLDESNIIWQDEAIKTILKQNNYSTKKGS